MNGNKIILFGKISRPCKKDMRLKGGLPYRLNLESNESTLGDDYENFGIPFAVQVGVPKQDVSMSDLNKLKSSRIPLGDHVHSRVEKQSLLSML